MPFFFVPLGISSARKLLSHACTVERKLGCTGWSWSSCRIQTLPNMISPQSHKRPLLPLTNTPNTTINCLLLLWIQEQSQPVMRYDDWDVILFPKDSHVPIQEFKTAF
jgi:hypothetical protein